MLENKNEDVYYDTDCHNEFKDGIIGSIINLDDSSDDIDFIDDYSFELKDNLMSIQED